MSEPGSQVAWAPLERHIAPLLLRLGIVERNEAELAERVQNARGSSVFVVRSTERLVAMFPDLLLADPSDGRWELRPLDAQLRTQWDARRRTILATEVPALNAAATAAAVDGADADERRGQLPQRAATARRVRIAALAGEQPAPTAPGGAGWWPWVWWPWFWRRPRPRPAPPPVAETGIDLEIVAERITALTEAGHAAEQEHAQFEARAGDFRRLRRRLDTLGFAAAD